MEVDVTDDVEVFLAEVEGFLAARPVEHNKILALAHFVREAPAPSRWAWVTDDGEVVGALAQMPVSSMATVTPMVPSAARALADRLSSDPAALPGVDGEAGTVAGLAGAWATARHVPAHPVEAHRLHRLGTLRAPRAVAGRPRPATVDDIPTILAWDEAFAFETGVEGLDDDREARITRRVERRLTSVWEVDDRVVSTASSLPPTAGVSRIRSVYTAPGERGRGYAAASVAAVSRRRVAEGARCILYTQLANPTSNRVYLHLGYEPVAEILVYRFAVPAAPAQGRGAAGTVLDQR